MARVQHPTLVHVFNDIPDDRLDAWLEAGWLECPSEIDGQETPSKAPGKAPKTPETPGE